MPHTHGQTRSYELLHLIGGDNLWKKEKLRTKPRYQFGLKKEEKTLSTKKNGKKKKEKKNTDLFEMKLP